MVVIVGVGIPLDGDLPPNGGSGHKEMIQRCAAAENHFSPCGVCVVTDPRRMIGEAVRSRLPTARVGCCVARVRDKPIRALADSCAVRSCRAL